LQYYNFLQAGTLDIQVLNPILNSTLHVSLFLKGFFDAEGGLYWRKGHGLEIKFSTTHKSLKEATIYSLEKLNIKYSIYIDKRFDRKHEKPCYYVRVFGDNARKLIVLTHPYKLFVKEYILKHVDSYYREKLMNLLKRSKRVVGGAGGRGSRPVTYGSADL